MSDFLFKLVLFKLGSNFTNCFQILFKESSDFSAYFMGSTNFEDEIKIQFEMGLFAVSMMLLGY